MYKIVLLEQAADDVERAIEWYETRQKNLGLKFLNRFQESLQKIREKPDAYPIKYGPLRMKIVKQFPYAIFFRTKDNTIQVHACLHYKQNIFSILQDR